jgi:hypothetical protein
MATKYIDDLRANVKRGNRARFQRGWPNHRPPAGYLEDRETKTIVKDPVRFPLIRRAWDLILAGTHRPSQIRRMLNEDWGFRTRKTKRQGGAPLTESGFYTLLSNPFFMGLIRLKNGDTYKGAHEPMLTPEEFERAQLLLRRPGRPRPSRHEFAYAGLLRCASCGRALVGEVHAKPSGQRYVYYRCHTNRLPTRCAEPGLPEARFEAQIAEDLSHMTLTAKAVAWIRDAVAASLGQELETLTAGRKSLEESIALVRREEETLLNLRLRGSIDDDTFDRRRKDLNDRRAQLELRLARPSESAEALLSRLGQALDFAVSAPKRFAEGPEVLRRQIVETVGSNYQVKNRKALYIANKPFSLFANGTASSLWWAIVEDVRKWLLNSRGAVIPKLDDASALTMPRRPKAA